MDIGPRTEEEVKVEASTLNRSRLRVDEQELANPSAVSNSASDPEKACVSPHPYTDRLYQNCPLGDQHRYHPEHSVRGWFQTTAWGSK